MSSGEGRRGGAGVVFKMDGMLWSRRSDMSQIDSRDS
jgi:hypothetical protein